MDTLDVPVLIAGAGPAGLTAAVTLSRYGIPVLVADTRSAPSTHAKATVVSTRSMELLRVLGMEQDTLAGGVDVEWLIWNCRTLTDVADGSGTYLGYPTRAQAARLSPSYVACVPQDHLESVLLRRLSRVPSAQVRFGLEVREVQSTAEGAAAVLRDVVTGQRQVVNARYLVVADGARSAIRQHLDIAMRGPETVMTFASAQFRAPLWETLGGHKYGLYNVAHPGAEGTFFPAGVGDRWLYAVFFDSPHSPRPAAEVDFVRRIRIGAGMPNLPVSVEKFGPSTAGAQLASEFRRGAAFLVGDAAHRVSPRGGTGMNMAIHGAYDLGWKLAWALRGWAHARILDSYEADRRPPAAHNVVRSADPQGTEREVERELRIDLNGRVPHAWLETTGESVSTIDLVGPGLTLFTGQSAGDWLSAASAVRDEIPIAVRSLDASAAQAVALKDGDALLVGPDGRPIARWQAHVNAVEALSAAVAAVARGKLR
ncbi:FAD-dependent monooxygenase [Micromonospora sp. NPDC051141]|uniref:FAD-dependent monooxygenase n=1 Tax=Micromonospora sp. NPDC051141 TaxID=3364284 RepID=UPI00379A4811